MAVSLPMQKRGSVVVQVGTCSCSLTKSFSPLVPSRLAIAVLDLYLQCCARATGANENNVHAQKPQRNKVKNEAIMPFFPQSFDTVITVHLAEKLQPQILSYPSICSVQRAPGVIL